MKLTAQKAKQILGLRIELENRKPESCPDCGCEKIYKTDHYRVKEKVLPETAPRDAPDNLKDQFYACANCGKYLKSDEPAARLY